MRHLPLSLCIAAASIMGGCGEDSATPNDEPEPSAPRRPGSAEAGWDTSVIASGNVGIQVALAADGGDVSVVYFSDSGRPDGLCQEIGGEDLPTRTLWDVFYAEEDTDWSQEQAVEILSFDVPAGMDYAIAPDGTPTIATLTGEPNVQLRYCGANDLGLYQRNGAGDWPVEVAVVSSGEAASGFPESDYGEIIGHFPGLAFDTDGNPAIAYKDVHGGGLQNDDFERADLEFAYRQGGGWTPTWVDIGKGAGNWNTVLFDADSRPHIVYYNPVEANLDNQHGLWVARSPDSGATWERVRLFSAPLANAPDAVIDGDGKVQVVYYDTQRGVPVLVGQLDSADFDSAADGWEETILGDSQYDEGYDPSIAVDSAGQLAVAYYRCTRTSGALGECNPNNDGLIFTYQSGDSWELEEIDAGADQGSCGRSPSLAFDSPGRPVLAYMCETLEDALLVNQAKFARRDRI